MEECEPPRRLLVLTRATDGPTSTIEATLTADGDQTILVIEERGMPLEHVADYGAGGQCHVEDLAVHIVGRERGDVEPGGTKLAPAYQKLAVSAE